DRRGVYGRSERPGGAPGALAECQRGAAAAGPGVQGHTEPPGVFVPAGGECPGAATLPATLRVLPQASHLPPK
ncbi:hypothetical protein ISCGN_005888, partial [Ixodes scapularis]